MAQVFQTRVYEGNPGNRVVNKELLASSVEKAQELHKMEFLRLMRAPGVKEASASDVNGYVEFYGDMGHLFTLVTKNVEVL